MRFSFVSVFAMAATALAGPIAAPDPAPAVPVERRQYTSEISTLTSLMSSVKEQTAAINATLSQVASGSLSQADAAAPVQSAVNEITSLVTSATSQVPTKREVAAGEEKRQSGSSTGDVASLLVEIFDEVLSTLNGVINSLGLGSISSLLGPLGSALSNLLLALEVVVNDLLALVQELLDGILTGLAGALTGIITL